MPQNGLLREIAQKLQKFGLHRSLASGDVGRIALELPLKLWAGPARWPTLDERVEAKHGDIKHTPAPYCWHVFGDSYNLWIESGGAKIILSADGRGLVLGTIEAFLLK